MADGRHFENSFIAISQPEIIRFQRNLVRRCTVYLEAHLRTSPRRNDSPGVASVRRPPL